MAEGTHHEESTLRPMCPFHNLLSDLSLRPIDMELDYHFVRMKVVHSSLCDLSSCIQMIVEGEDVHRVCAIQL